MKKSRLHLSAVLSLSALACFLARDAHSAPGAELSRLAAPLPCDRGVGGLGIDQARGLLYYTMRSDPVGGAVHWLELPSGTYGGSFQLKRDGQRLVTPASGLAFDPVRKLLWVRHSGWFSAVDPANGEIVLEVQPVSWFPLLPAAYDPLRDFVAVADDRQVSWWDTTPPVGRLDSWYNAGGLIKGLTFDGVELWEIGRDLDPPAPPNVFGLFPRDSDRNIDYSRLLTIPGDQLNDLAFDCTTFPVNVIWVANHIVCEMVAYEVDSKADCTVPSWRLFRASFEDREPTQRKSKLPLNGLTADRTWQVPLPLSFVDEDGGILNDPNRPMVFYRLLDGDDNDLGNVLQAVKDRSVSGVHIVQ